VKDFERIRSIDGLRGLSILLVLLCHLGIPGFSGGFVGVDVFFVISGFVITGSLYPHLCDPDLIASFYERRIRRLLPSLLVTVSICCLAFLLLYEADQRANLAMSTAFAILGLSNFYFSHNGGYFDDTSLDNPLIHTWSLAVEEQFYVLFTILLILARMAYLREPKTLPRALVVWMTIGTVLSLALSLYLSKANARFSYFLLPTRFWEIGVGSLLCFARERAEPRDGFPAPMLGLIPIFIAACCFNENTPYPSFYALLPAVGAALIIAGSRNPRSLANKFLSSAPMFFLGTISYAFYLVHWPLIVFAQDYVVTDLSVAQKISIGVASVVVATLLTFLFEVPFRKRWILKSRRSLFAFSGAGIVSILALAALRLPDEQAPALQQRPERRVFGRSVDPGGEFPPARRNRRFP